MGLLFNHIVYDAAAYELDTSTGRFAFDDMLGAPQPKTEQLEVIARPGVDGENLRETGVRAEPTALRTLVYLADRGDAKTAIESYAVLIDGEPYEIIQHGQSWGFYRVLKVVPQPLLPCAVAAGTLVVNPSVLLIADWLLLGTEAPA